METVTPQRRDHARHIPGYVDGSLVALVHRRAAEAALLRDRRLELSIDASGKVRARMVDGVPPLQVSTVLRLVG